MTITTTKLSSDVEAVVIAQASIAMGITNEVDRYVAYEEAKEAISKVCGDPEYTVAVRAYLKMIAL